MNTKIQQNEKGFTMIELIVVVAIMAIIGAVLVPMFSQMSLKSRLTSDISSIKTFQRQIDAYRTEHGKYPGSFTTSSGISTNAVNGDVGQELVDSGYIDEKDLSAASGGGLTVKLQTGGEVKTSGASCVLYIGSGISNHLEYKAVVDAYKDTDGNKGWVKVD